MFQTTWANLKVFRHRRRSAVVWSRIFDPTVQVASSNASVFSGRWHLIQRNPCSSTWCQRNCQLFWTLGFPRKFSRLPSSWNESGCPPYRNCGAILACKRFLNSPLEGAAFGSLSCDHFRAKPIPSVFRSWCYLYVCHYRPVNGYSGISSRTDFDLPKTYQTGVAVGLSNRIKWRHKQQSINTLQQGGIG